MGRVELLVVLCFAASFSAASADWLPAIFRGLFETSGEIPPAPAPYNFFYAGAPTAPKSVAVRSRMLWAESADRWPYPWHSLSTVQDAFGKDAEDVYGLISMWDGILTRGEDGYSSLLKEGVTALLNAEHSKKFKWSPEEVRNRFVAALCNEKAAKQQATEFAMANVQFSEISPNSLHF